MRLDARITRHVNRLFAHAQDTLDNREIKRRDSQQSRCAD
ncbi:hypothetical protein QF049_003696 [Paenibacillus sp. W4I10]|nr:hypothetical protein [Paenibacillus sp. W4I10]